MQTKNIVFVGRSIDGFIAGKNGELEWLDMVPNPKHDDMGFHALMSEVDGVVMGRATFEVVLGFEGDWFYSKHIFVLSNSMQEIPEKAKGKASLLKGDVEDILDEIHKKGFHKLYIDGGKVVQDFLAKDLIDELRLTTIPILLGDGIPLFSVLENAQKFEHLKTEVFLDQIVQTHYRRVKG